MWYTVRSTLITIIRLLGSRGAVRKCTKTGLPAGAPTKLPTGASAGVHASLYL